jgi:hypothetical protein
VASIPSKIERFARDAPDVRAVLQRVGAGTYDLVLIDADGNWERAVVPTEAEARAFVAAIKVPLHEGWEDPALAQRINGLDAWANPAAKRRAL